MKLKHLSKFFSMLLVIALVGGCSDDFTEEDFVQLQSDLARQTSDENAAALAIASVLQSLTIQVQEDEAPLEGVSVTISNPGAAEATVSTNTNGNAIFSNVVIGGNTINVSLEGYLSAQVVVDFGEVEEGDEYRVIDGRIVPIPRSESVVIPMISAAATSGSTATIRGRVTIETDLTNDAPEVPQDIQIRANFADSDDVDDVIASGGVSVESFTFNEGLGVANVDNTTGEYSLLVPAGADGTDVELLIPELELNQTVAVSELDGDDIEPEYRSVPTLFGPIADDDYDDIPEVFGAKAVFPEAPAAGDGFTLSGYARVGRELNFATDAFTTPSVTNDMRFQFTSLGAGYTESPTVAVADPTGTGAEPQAWIEFAIGGINVTTTGTGYNAGTVFVDIFALNSGGGTIFINTIGVTPNASNEITQAVVTDAVEDAISSGDSGFELDNLFEISQISTGFRVDFPTSPSGGTDATGTLSLAKSQVHRVAVFNGENYTSPTITFSGGGGTSQAVMNIIAFATQWSFNLDNSGNTSDYNVLFDDITFVKTTPSLSNFEDDDVESTVTGFDENFLNTLTVSGGDVVYYDAAEDYITEFRSTTEPTIIIEMSEPETAEADVEINDDGEVDDLDDVVEGSGYAMEFQVTIMPAIDGAPGTGATITLEDFFTDDQTRETTWDGDFFITNMGSGYLDNLNQADFEGFSGGRNYNVRSGETIIVNIDYGTGDRQEDVGPSGGPI